jgi:IS66 C-terminal element
MARTYSNETTMAGPGTRPGLENLRGSCRRGCFNRRTGAAVLATEAEVRSGVWRKRRGGGVFPRQIGHGFTINQKWLADVLARINDHNIQNLDQLLPWNWKAVPAKLAA